MERYNITWTLSPSTFVEKQQLWVGVNGAPAAQNGADMSSSQDLITVDFNTNDAISLFIRVIGDNGTQADSTPAVTFTAKNQEAVAPASNVAAAWVKHID